MGAVVSALTRRIQRFNFENRVHREISKEKPTPAPPYPSTAREIERSSKETTQAIEEHFKKDPVLSERLKNVYLISYDENTEVASKAAGLGRPLPVTRNKLEETEFGFLEPKMLPKGRVTLRQALKFIAEYQSDPKNSAAAIIASQHNISLEITENILKYFKTFEVILPETKEKIGESRTTVTLIEGKKSIEEK